MNLILKKALFNGQTLRIAELTSHLAISYRIALVILLVVLAKKISIKLCFSFLKWVAELISIYRELLLPLYYALGKFVFNHL